MKGELSDYTVISLKRDFKEMQCPACNKGKALIVEGLHYFVQFSCKHIVKL